MVKIVRNVHRILLYWQGHPVRKKTEWWGAGMVVCLERLAYGPADATATHCLLLQ